MTVNVYRVTAAGASVVTLHRVTASSSVGGSRARVFTVSASASMSVPNVFQVTAVSSGAPVTPIVDPIPARTVDGWDTVTITPTAAPAADTWIFTVLAGGVTLSGSGTSRTFTAPALFKGTTVRVGVQASKAGVASVQEVGVYTVKPWNSFILIGTSSTTDIVDGNVPAAAPAAAFDVVDGRTASTDVLSGGTASLPVNVVDGRTGTSTSTLEAIDGGTGSTPADTVDGGTDTGTGATWVPRRPIQLI